MPLRWLTSRHARYVFQNNGALTCTDLTSGMEAPSSPRLSGGTLLWRLSGDARLPVSPSEGLKHFKPDVVSSAKSRVLRGDHLPRARRIPPHLEASGATRRYTP